MSDTREPSYYEVALSNRQALMALVILLASVVAAFLSGVWVGKGADPIPDLRAKTEPAQLEQVAQASEPTKELQFFELNKKPPAEPAPQATAPSGADGATSEPEVRDLTAGDQEESEPVSIPAPTVVNPRPRPPEPAPAATQEPPRQRPAPAPAQAASRPATEPAAPATDTETVVIQVLSSRDQAKARRVLRELLDGGYPASLTRVEQNNLLMYRVRVGPYSQRTEAERVADRVRRAFKLDTWITPE